MENFKDDEAEITEEMQSEQEMKELDGLENGQNNIGDDSLRDGMNESVDDLDKEIGNRTREESEKLTEKYFPDLEGEEKDVKVREAMDDMAPRIEAEVEAEHRLKDIESNFDNVTHINDPEVNEFASWNPENSELVINDAEWDKMSTQEQCAILKHEQYHMDHNNENEGYTPIQELNAHEAGLEEWQKQQEKYKELTGEDLECSHPDLKDDFDKTEKSQEQAQRYADSGDHTQEEIENYRLNHTVEGDRAKQSFRNVIDGN
jgi:hypothetical protein